VPQDATKETPGIAVIRDRYKVGLLAIQYGVSAFTLATRLGVSTFEAQKMIDQHHEIFAQYWRWSDDWLASSLNTGIMRTVMGWTCRTGITELSERSIRNWPIQANGAEILRIACILMHRHGIGLVAPVHDAVLIEAPVDRIGGDIVLARELMRRASKVVLNQTAAGTIELRTDATPPIVHPARYQDKRGLKVWADVLEHLADYERNLTEEKEKTRHG
jgi:DNA polymerase I-like protein with 3'-5' exonuclease and polymerase domains